MIEVAHIVARVTTDLTRFNLGMSAAEMRAKTMTQRMGLQGQRLTKYMSLPGAAIAYSAVKSWGDFSANLTRIRTQAGGAAIPIDKLRKTVENMARTSVFGPTELAKGMYHVQSVMGGGMANMKQKTDVLNQSQKLAALGGSELEATTTALTAAVRTGIPGTQKMGEAWKTINGIVGSGNMRMEDFVGALGTGVLPVAKLAGLTFTDVGSALTIFTDEGMNANEAMTRFRTSLLMMQAPSKKGAANLAKLGLSGQKIGDWIRGGATRKTAFAQMGMDQAKLADQMRSKKGFVGAIQEIKKHYDAFAKAHGKTAALAAMARAFGGSRTAGTVMLLVNQANLLQKKHQQIEKTASKTQKLYEEQMKTFSAQMHRAWSNVQVGLEQLGEAIAPTILAITKVIAGIAKAFSHLNPHVRKIIGAMLLFAITIGPLMVIGSGLITLFTGGVGAVKAFTMAWRLLNAAFLESPVGWILLIALLALWISRNKRAMYEIRMIWDFIKHVFMSTVRAIFGFLKSYWPLLVGILLGPVGLAAALIYRHWRDIMHFFTRTIPRWFHAGVRFGKAIFNGLKHGLAGMRHWLVRFLNSSLNPLSGLGHGIGAAIEEGAHLAGRAAGGPVTGGRPYMVGERGPELFMPRGSGTIVPNGYTGGMGGGPMVHIGEVHVRHEEDVEVLSAKLARRVVLR